MDGLRPVAAIGAVILAVGWSGGCGASDDDAATPVDGGVSSGGAAGSSPTLDAAGTDAPSPSDAGPSTQAYDPCATAACWTAPTLGACGATTVKESFSSGLYAVHRYLLMAPAGVEISLTATRTAGSWSPVLIVHDEHGTTVHDGAKSHSTSALEVSALSPQPTPDSVGARIKASTRMHLGVFLTGANVVAKSFSDALPTDAKYTLEAAIDCPPPAPLYVRGVKLDAEQELWVRYIGEQVVPKVPGSPTERIDKSAYVAWWSLKEGVLDVNNPLSYSNCSIPPDKHIGPVELCPDPKNAWQVGLSGVQVTYNTLEGVEQTASAVFPQQTITEILVDAAVAAGFGETTSLGQTIATSADRLRLSWLLRSGAVGFEAQYPAVHSQCFLSAKPWCFGSGWPASASFAATQADAQQAVADLKAIFETMAP